MSKNAAPRSELQLQTSSWFLGMDPLSDLLSSRGEPTPPTHPTSATQDIELPCEPDSGPVVVLQSLSSTSPTWGKRQRWGATAGPC